LPARPAPRRRVRRRYGTYYVYHLLDGHIFGFSLWEIAYTTMPLDEADVVKLLEAIPWDEYPHLTKHRDEHLTEGPHEEVSAFEVGLDLILEGLEQTLEA
jgi:hypothetical protein